MLINEYRKAISVSWAFTKLAEMQNYEVISASVQMNYDALQDCFFLLSVSLVPFVKA